MPNIPQNLFDALTHWSTILVCNDAPIVALHEAQNNVRTLVYEWVQPQQRTAELSPNNIFALFAKAQASGLKYPKLTFDCVLNGNRKLVFSLNGSKSQHKGDVTVTDGGSYGSNEYYARIEAATSAPIYSRMATKQIQAQIEQILENLIGLASETGVRTSNCCFCCKQIQNPNSLAVGYGPICAENYGLPWEGTAEALKKAMAEESVAEDVKETK